MLSVFESPLSCSTSEIYVAFGLVTTVLKNMQLKTVTLAVWWGRALLCGGVGPCVVLKNMQLKTAPLALWNPHVNFVVWRGRALLCGILM